jgi:hypothetical protein
LVKQFLLFLIVYFISFTWFGLIIFFLLLHPHLAVWNDQLRIHLNQSGNIIIGIKKIINQIKILFLP